MANYLVYRNQRATRSQPLDEDLIKRLAYLEDMGVTAHVISGGQPGIDEGGARTGSTRHDHGHSMDADFYIGDRKLDWNNPDDLPVFQQIVSRGKAAGITGIGGADDYMGAGRLHMGMGTPSRWGAGGKSANAPKWLAAAYDGAEFDPVTEVVAAAPARSSSPLSDNPLAASVQAKLPDDSAPKPGILLQAYNKITGSNITPPKTIPDSVPILGGADTSKVMKGIGGIGDFAKVLTAQDDALNSQTQAIARSAAARAGSDAPIEIAFEPTQVMKKRRRGGLGGIGGYLIG